MKKEDELIGILHCLFRMYQIYSNQKTEAGKERWKEHLSLGGRYFKEECEKTYNINQSLSEWIRFIRNIEKQKNRTL